MDITPSQKKAKGIWTEAENALLVQLAEASKDFTWKGIANELNHRCGSHKTGKQCRERYRNYANPGLDKSDWCPYEKLLAVVLHQIYGNQWNLIAKLLKNRSDVVIKNHIYSTTRRALKILKAPDIPTSLLNKPHKLCQIYMSLEYAKRYYLSEDTHKEKLIVNLLKDREVTTEVISKYQEILLNKCEAASKGKKLPQEIALDLQDFGLTKDQAEDVLAKKSIFSYAPLNEIVKVRLMYQRVNPEVPPPAPVVSLQPVSSPLYYVPHFPSFYPHPVPLSVPFPAPVSPLGNLHPLPFFHQGPPMIWPRVQSLGTNDLPYSNHMVPALQGVSGSSHTELDLEHQEVKKDKSKKMEPQRKRKKRE